METQISTPIDIVGLREQLSKLTLDNLKIQFEKLGIIDHWKNGMNKQSLVEKGIAAYVELQGSKKPVETTEVSRNLVVEIPVGEYDVDEETLIEFPELIELGFSIGDVLVHEEGKAFFIKGVEAEVIETIKVEDAEVLVPEGNENPNLRTEGITTKKTIEEVDSEIKKLNKSVPVFEETVSVEEEVDEEEILDGNEVVKEYEPEVIDESKYTEEELLENIEICNANCRQALPSTRITLLRKVDALELALERKRK